MTDLRKSAAIVGAYEHPVRYAPDKSETLIMAESIIGALADAGLEKNDVDAIFSAGGLSGYNLVDYLFIKKYKSSIVVSIYFSRHSFLLYLNILFNNSFNNLIFKFNIVYIF